MKDVRTTVVSDEFRDAVTRLATRLGAVPVVASRQWQHLVDQCWLDTADNSGSGAIVFGPPAVVLKYAAAATDPFGFVMPVAQTRRPWQRATAWRDEATLDLWRAGWSPQAIERILVPTHQAIVEFVIGDARRTPAPAPEPLKA